MRVSDYYNIIIGVQNVVRGNSCVFPSNKSLGKLEKYIISTVVEYTT